MRRVQKRMQMLLILSYSDYTDYLQLDSEEFTHLFSIIEINVTSFFRDADSWDYVVAQLIPRIITGKSTQEPIRVWSAGCASGEEIYTLAMLLAEALGMEQYNAQIKIFATDVDVDALKHARKGSYSASKVADIPGKLLKKYFEQIGSHYVVCRDLRPSIIFSCHNVIQDASMSKIDLLVCRNVLIYFNIESQMKVLARFHFSLKDRGFLFLGQAEMIPIDINFFTTLDRRHHVFTKVAKRDLNQRLLHKLVS